MRRRCRLVCSDSFVLLLPPNTTPAAPAVCWLLAWHSLSPAHCTQTWKLMYFGDWGNDLRGPWSGVGLSLMPPSLCPCPALCSRLGFCPPSTTEPQNLFQGKQAPWEKPRRNLYKPGDGREGGNGRIQYFSTSPPCPQIASSPGGKSQ